MSLKTLVIFLNLCYFGYAVNSCYNGSISTVPGFNSNETNTMSCTSLGSKFCVKLYSDNSIDNRIPQGYIAAYSCDSSSPNNLCTTNGCTMEGLPIENQPDFKVNVCCCSTDMCNLNMVNATTAKPNPTTTKPNPTTTKLSPTTRFGALLNLILPVTAYSIYQILQK